MPDSTVPISDAQCTVEIVFSEKEGWTLSTLEGQVFLYVRNAAVNRKHQLFPFLNDESRLVCGDTQYAVTTMSII